MSLLRRAGSLAVEGDPIRLTPDDAGWTWCGLHVISLAPGESRKLELTGAEAAVVPLSGGCVVDGDDFFFELRGRDSVFSRVTDLCYVPTGSQALVSSVGGGQFAVATAATAVERPACYYRADGVDVSVRGSGPASRQINGLLSADVEGPDKLIVVEVLTPEGNWSSYPPHKHDEWDDEEVPLEEIYYFRVAGKDGFALHRTYTSDGGIDETVTVADGDLFLVPRGYHGPCVAAPGYDLYYLNVMAGPDPERRWLICTDPAHAWLWDAWNQVPTDPRLPMTCA